MVIAIFAVLGVLILAIVAIAIGALSGVFKKPAQPVPNSEMVLMPPLEQSGAAGI